MFTRQQINAYREIRGNLRSLACDWPRSLRLRSSGWSRPGSAYSTRIPRTSIQNIHTFIIREASRAICFLSILFFQTVTLSTSSNQLPTFCVTIQFRCHHLIFTHPDRRSVSMLDNGEYVLYHYSPSVAAAAVTTAVFAVLTGLHAYRMIKTKLWFCIPFTLGGVCGYSCFIDRQLGSPLIRMVPRSRTYWIHRPCCRSQ